MYALVLLIHIVVCLFLIAVILVQGGRGGLSETLGGTAAQSLFGGGVANVMTKVTTVCASLFVVTCLSLAYLSTARGRSVVEQVPLSLPQALPRHPSPPASTPSAAPSGAPAEAPAAASSAPQPSAPEPSSTAQPAAQSPGTQAQPAPTRESTPSH